MANNLNNLRPLIPGWSMEEMGDKGMERFLPQMALQREDRSRAAPERFAPEAPKANKKARIGHYFPDDDLDLGLDFAAAAPAPAAGGPAPAYALGALAALAAGAAPIPPPVIDLTQVPTPVLIDLTGSPAPSPFDESQEVIPVNMAASDDAINRARFNAGVACVPGHLYYAPMWYHPRNVIPDKSFLNLNAEGKVESWLEDLEDLDDVMAAPPMSAGELARRFRREEAAAAAADEARKRLRRE